MLLSTRIYSKFDKLPRVAGKVPLMLLNLVCKPCKFVKSANSSTSVPVISLLSKINHSNDCNFVISVGIVDVNKLLPNIMQYYVMERKQS